MPADGIVIAKEAFRLVEQLQGYQGEEVASYLFHAFGTNLQFEDGEFNFVKTRAKHGTKQALRAVQGPLRGAGELTRAARSGVRSEAKRPPETGPGSGAENRVMRLRRRRSPAAGTRIQSRRRDSDARTDRQRGQRRPISAEAHNPILSAGAEMGLRWPSTRLDG